MGFLFYYRRIILTRTRRTRVIPSLHTQADYPSQTNGANSLSRSSIYVIHILLLRRSINKRTILVKLYVREFLLTLLDSLVNHECGKCSVNSIACVTKKYTILTNIFNEVTVTVRLSPTSVSVFKCPAFTHKKQKPVFIPSNNNKSK